MPPHLHMRRIQYKRPLDVYPSLIVAHLFNGAVVASDSRRPLPRCESLPVGAYVAHEVRRESGVRQVVAAPGVLECASVGVFVAGHAVYS